MDDLEALARATFRAAGIAASDEDVGLAILWHRTLFAQLERLEAVDTARFPFEPVDPSAPPGSP